MIDPFHEDLSAVVPVLTKVMTVIEEARKSGTNTNALVNALLNAQMMIILTSKGDPIAAVDRAHAALLGMVRLNMNLNAAPKGPPA